MVKKTNITLDKDLAEKFDAIQKRTGLKSRINVVRYLVSKENQDLWMDPKLGSV